MSKDIRTNPKDSIACGHIENPCDCMNPKDLDEIAEGDYDGKLTPESKAQILKHYRSVDDIKKAVGENPYDLYDATLQHYGYNQAVADLYTALGIEGEE